MCGHRTNHDRDFGHLVAGKLTVMIPTVRPVPAWMIRRQKMCVCCDHATRFAAPRLLQGTLETHEQIPVCLALHRLREDGGGGADTHGSIHEILLFRTDSRPISLTAS
jgi:hypothetical protein